MLLRALQIENLVDQIGALNLFEVAEFVECLRVKLKLEDVPMGMMMAGAPAAGGDAGGDAVGEIFRNSRAYNPPLVLICNIWLVFWDVP